jgi:hypothetical protein
VAGARRDAEKPGNKVPDNAGKERAKNGLLGNEIDINQAFTDGFGDGMAGKGTDKVEN